MMIHKFKKRFPAALYLCVWGVIISFTATLVVPPPVYAQGVAQIMPGLLAPGTMIPPSEAFVPTLVKGLRLYEDDSLKFDFIIDPGNAGLKGDEFKAESEKLIRYFLASLTVPEDEMWVNLSPHEKDRIIPEGLGATDMGRDLLTQDYLLKQLTASLVYPEDKLGQKFWDRVRGKIHEKYGSGSDVSDIPSESRSPDRALASVEINTFNKVWIVPDKAKVYEWQGKVFVMERHLKVMMEEDYGALSHNGRTQDTGHTTHDKDGLKTSKGMIEDNATPLASRAQRGETGVPTSHTNTKDEGRGTKDMDTPDVSRLMSNVVKEIIIPEIEREVNEGKNFAKLRQIYNSMILATWYKKRLKESLLGQVYVDKNKTFGVDIEDKDMKEKVYRQYLEAFQKGVYSYIKEDYDPTTRQMIPRKYFSGGMVGLHAEDLAIVSISPEALAPRDMAQLVHSEAGPETVFPTVTWAAVENAARPNALAAARVPGNQVSDAAILGKEEAAWISQWHSKLSLSESGVVVISSSLPELLLETAWRLENLEEYLKETRRRTAENITHVVSEFMQQMKGEYRGKEEAKQNYWAGKIGVLGSFFSGLARGKVPNKISLENQTKLLKLPIPKEKLIPLREQEDFLSAAILEGQRFFGELLGMAHRSYRRLSFLAIGKAGGFSSIHLSAFALMRKEVPVGRARLLAVTIGDLTEGKVPRPVAMSVTEQNLLWQNRELNQAIGQMLASARRSRNLSQSQLARLVGLTAQRVNALESGLDAGGGDVGWPEKAFRKLADALEISFDDVLNDPEVRVLISREAELGQKLFEYGYSAKEELRQLRNEFGLTQTQLAERTGFSQVDISAFEKVDGQGGAPVMPYHALHLARGLDGSVSDLWPMDDLKMIRFEPAVATDFREILTGVLNLSLEAVEVALQAVNSDLRESAEKNWRKLLSAPDRQEFEEQWQQSPQEALQRLSDEAMVVDVRQSASVVNEDLALRHADAAMVGMIRPVGGDGAAVNPAVMAGVVSARSVVSGKTDKVGGINLDAAMLGLQIERDGNGVPLPLPRQPIQELDGKIRGFAPWIIHINFEPVSVPMLLGVADTDQQEGQVSFHFLLDPFLRSEPFDVPASGDV